MGRSKGANGAIPRRTLGRTGVEVSALALGGYVHLEENNMDFHHLMNSQPESYE